MLKVLWFLTAVVPNGWKYFLHRHMKLNVASVQPAEVQNEMSHRQLRPLLRP